MSDVSDDPERDPDILFEKYVEILQQNCEDPRLREIEERLKKSGYVIKIPKEEQREIIDQGLKDYRSFVVNVYLLGPNGEVCISLRQLKVLMPEPLTFDPNPSGYDRGFLDEVGITWQEPPAPPPLWTFTYSERHSLLEALKRHWSDILTMASEKNLKTPSLPAFAQILESAISLTPTEIEQITLPFLTELELEFLERFDSEDLLDCGCTAFDHAEATIWWRARNLGILL